MISRLQYIPKIVASGQFKSNPLWKQPGGLDGVNAALELLKAGKTSGNKITLLF